MNKLFLFLLAFWSFAWGATSAVFALEYIEIGNMFMRYGEYDKAISYLESEIVLHPNNAAAYNDLGTTYLLMKRPVEAEKSFRRAAELDQAGPIGLSARKSLYQLNAGPVVIVDPPKTSVLVTKPHATTNGISVFRSVDPSKQINATHPLPLIAATGSLKSKSQYRKAKKR